MLIRGGPGPGKIKVLLNLIDHEPDIDIFYLYGKDLYEPKYQLRISERESTGLKYLNDLKVFIEYSNNMDDIYKKNEEHNTNKKRKILIFFDDMISNMLSNKKINIIIQ